MSPTEFTVRMFAADQRFSQALKQDNIPEMRAALAEKTGLIEVYFAEPRDRVDAALGGGAHAG
jgi:hypothetical protein